MSAASSVEFCTPRQYSGHNMQRSGQTWDPTSRMRNTMRIRAGASAIAAVMAFAAVASAQDVDAGRKSFESRCARCHGADGNGGEMGPAIARAAHGARRQAAASVDQHGRARRAACRRPRCRRQRWMPSSSSCAPSNGARRASRSSGRPFRRPTARRSTGRSWARASTTCSCSATTSACTCCGGRASAIREVTSETDWPTYNGDPRGNRYTTLTQIDKDNVARLAPKWMFTDSRRRQLCRSRRSVVDGIMYVTAPNECFALDAGTGRRIWHLQAAAHEGRRRRRTPIAASASPAIACSWSPTTRTSSR